MKMKNGRDSGQPFLQQVWAQGFCSKVWLALFSGCSGSDLPFFFQTTVLPENLAAAAACEWFSNRAADRRSLACAGDTPESALFCLDVAERPGPVPRIPMVLFCE